MHSSLLPNTSKKSTDITIFHNKTAIDLSKPKQKLDNLIQTKKALQNICQQKIKVYHTFNPNSISTKVNNKNNDILVYNLQYIPANLRKEENNLSEKCVELIDNNADKKYLMSNSKNLEIISLPVDPISNIQFKHKKQIKTNTD